MKESINLTFDKELGKSISEVTSISLDTDYEINDEEITGKFLIEGTYKSHGLCLNQEDFIFTVPFSYEIKDNMDSDTLKIEVTDFTYSIEADKLCLDIEYDVLYEEIKEEEEEEDFAELDRFIKSYEVDLEDVKEEIDAFKEEIETTEERKVNVIEEEPILVPIEVEESSEDHIEEVETHEHHQEEVTTSIIETAASTKDEYITYHVYLCNETDTLETIAKKYNIDYTTLKEYNPDTEIKLGAKLIIPCNND